MAYQAKKGSRKQNIILRDKSNEIIVKKSNDISNDNKRNDIRK